MGLVAIDVHGKLTAGSAPLASGVRFSSRHCKGAPAMPFPLLKMASLFTKSLSTPDTGNILSSFSESCHGRFQKA
jgi:hypothetical protein